MRIKRGNIDSPDLWKSNNWQLTAPGMRSTLYYRIDYYFSIALILFIYLYIFMNTSLIEKNTYIFMRCESDNNNSFKALLTVEYPITRKIQ